MEKVVVSEKNEPLGGVGKVADVSLITPAIELTAVEGSGINKIFPQISQSPAVNVIEVIFLLELEVRVTGDKSGTVLSITSPTLPAFALLFVVTPMSPAVD